jgi:hypothetical protein
MVGIFPKNNFYKIFSKKKVSEIFSKKSKKFSKYPKYFLKIFKNKFSKIFKKIYSKIFQKIFFHQEKTFFFKIFSGNIFLVLVDPAYKIVFRSHHLSLSYTPGNYPMLLIPGTV